MLVEIIKQTSEDLRDDKKPSDVFLHLVEEVGELALEINIDQGTSYKDAGEDGIVGEGIDVIINALDIIFRHRPDITEEELAAYAAKKCQKWRSKVEG